MDVHSLIHAMRVSLSLSIMPTATAHVQLEWQYMIFFTPQDQGGDLRAWEKYASRKRQRRQQKVSLHVKLSLLPQLFGIARAVEISMFRQHAARWGNFKPASEMNRHTGVFVAPPWFAHNFFSRVSRSPCSAAFWHRGTLDSCLFIALRPQTIVSEGKLSHSYLR